jgi:hypothetical protein
MENKTHSEDYIAVPSFKNVIIRAVRFLFRFWAFLGLTVRKNTVFLIVGAIAGGLVGLALHLVNGKNFKVSMVVNYTALDKRAYTNVLEQLESLVNTRSYETLAGDLKISDVIAENIKTIEGRNLDDLYLGKDTSSYPFFKIVVGLKSPYGADSLQDALLGYFNDLPFLKKQKEDQIKVYKDQLTYIQSENGRMDSLKQEYVHSLANMKIIAGGIYSNAFDPANIYRQSFQLDTMQASINTWLNAKSMPMQLVSGFRTTKTPQSISRTVSIAACIIGGFLFALVLALLGEINKKFNAA